MVNTVSDLDFYKIPLNGIQQTRIEFYNLKRGIDETIEQWMNRVQSSIICCDFPANIYRFLLIDRFLCGLHQAEMQVIRSAGTWSTLKQLIALLTKQKDVSAENQENIVDITVPETVCIAVISYFLR